MGFGLIVSTLAPERGRQLDVNSGDLRLRLGGGPQLG